MKLSATSLMGLSVSTIVFGIAGSATADWTSFVIRQGGTPLSSPVIQPNNVYQPNATEFIIAAGSQKAAWGTSDIDGTKVGDITRIAITRLDNRSRFTAGQGPHVAPYLNLWITDGTHYAVVGNEPSDSNFQPLYANGYDLSFAELSDKAAKIYEITDKSWLPNNGVGLTFADLADFTIKAPTVAELQSGWLGLGGGAPRELGTNEAFGVNWVFGDSLSNYVSGAEGYVVADPIAIPEPASLGLLGVAGMLVGRRRRV